MKSRWVLVVGGVAMGVVVAVGILLWQVGVEGSTRIEAMVAARLQTVANRHLQPVLTLGDLDYQYPRTVVATDARLTTEDGLELVRVDRMTLVLKELPRTGAPMRIERLVLESPRVIVADATRDRGLVLGWSNLFRTPLDEVEAPGQLPVHVSDVFQVSRIEIENGLIRYEDRNHCENPLPAMELTGLNAGLDIQPDQPGQYTLNTRITGPAMFIATMDGTLDLDRAVLCLEALQLTMHLKPDTAATLPPMVQAWLAAHEVTGRLRLQGRGHIPLGDPEQADVQIDFLLAGTSGVFDGVMLDLTQMSGQIVLTPGKAAVRNLLAAGYGGTLEGQIDLETTPPHPATLQLSGKGIRLERLIRATSSEDSIRQLYEGAVFFATELKGPLATLARDSSGEGWLSVREGRLIGVPLLSRLRRIMGTGDSPEAESAATGGQDRADLEWRYQGDHLLFTQLEAITRWLAVRGEGRLYYDGSLDLRLNGGPLERLQHAMGFVGDWMGRVTDKVVTYWVTGHVRDPVVQVRPLGLGRSGPSRTAEVPADEEAR